MLETARYIRAAGNHGTWQPIDRRYYGEGFSMNIHELGVRYWTGAARRHGQPLNIQYVRLPIGGLERNVNVSY